MAVDPTTMAIITAVGTTGATVGGGLWAYVKTLHTTTVKELRDQNIKLEQRTAECEDDRTALHGRLNDQAERITKISQSLGRLEGKFEHIAKDHQA